MAQKTLLVIAMTVCMTAAQGSKTTWFNSTVINWPEPLCSPVIHKCFTYYFSCAGDCSSQKAFATINDITGPESELYWDVDVDDAIDEAIDLLFYGDYNISCNCMRHSAIISGCPVEIKSCWKAKSRATIYYYEAWIYTSSEYTGYHCCEYKNQNLSISLALQDLMDKYPACFTASPTTKPTVMPTTDPSTSPTVMPTAHPTTIPTVMPTEYPTTSPTMPTTDPSTSPTVMPTAYPTTIPTVMPTTNPTIDCTNCIAFDGLHCSSGYQLYPINADYCQPCPGNTAGTDGNCFACKSGHEPNFNRTDCEEKGSQIWWKIVSIVAGGIVSIIAGLAGWWIKRKCKKKQSTNNLNECIIDQTIEFKKGPSNLPVSQIDDESESE